MTTLPTLEECVNYHNKISISSVKVFITPVIINIIHKALIELKAGPNNKKISFWFDAEINEFLSYNRIMGDNILNNTMREELKNYINEKIADSEWKVVNIRDEFDGIPLSREFHITVVHNTYKKTCVVQ